MMEIATTPITQFDEVTNTSFLGKTESGTYIFTGAASIKWAIGDVPNGGYVMSVIIDSVIQLFSERHQTDPVALNCFFFNKTLPGHLIIEIEELKMSRKGYCIVRASLKQTSDLSALDDLTSYDPSQWSDKVQGIFTMGNMDTEQGVTHFYKNPSPPRLDHLQPYKYRFMGDFVDALFDKTIIPKAENDSHDPELTQVMNFKDGRPIDFKSIPYWCDMLITPPSLLGHGVLGGPVWCPTMQLEVQFKRKPSGQKIIAHFLTKHIINNRFDIDGEIWNEQGEIIAITRHQNLIVPWSRNVKSKI
ncbi:thioesterase-like superfamily-domain-containing protein [Mucor mucedo]|uniref:thioesterase-like superfamily-domain-containing protein n=1 Tax=Mucor mucedo TaxID=29922 RepID=UPI00221E74B1|nr:thioesterase-like superfamily-domain-containing protein [Mucor mucedo]KAI7895398.1 thioesterase-like superfamily-domain-containing protein [Mucor mucedo]